MVGVSLVFMTEIHLLASGSISQTTSVGLRDQSNHTKLLAVATHIPSKPACCPVKWYLCIFMSLIFEMQSDNLFLTGYERSVPKRVTSPRLYKLEQGRNQRKSLSLNLKSDSAKSIRTFQPEKGTLCYISLNECIFWSGSRGKTYSLVNEEGMYNHRPCE